MRHNYSRIQSFFEDQVVAMPDRIAVIYKENSLTYQQLDNASEKLKNYLLVHHAEEDVIGVSALKHLHTITSILAILKAGKTYVVIDTLHPLERLASVIEIAGVHACIASDVEKSQMEALGLHFIHFSAQDSDNQCLSKVFENEILAILFTSGSTGVPKGVRLKHKGLIEMVKFRQTQIGENRQDNVLQFCYLGFDGAIKEIFVAISSGNTLHLIDEVDRLDSKFLLNYVLKHEINRLFLPFVSLQYFVDEILQSEDLPYSLTEITTGGELLKITPQIRSCFVKLPNTKLRNLYGPTEASVFVTAHTLEGDANKWDEIPHIGYSVADCRLYVLNEQLHQCANGESGELYIMGNCLAEGYQKRDDLTAEFFVSVPNLDPDFQIAYKSGDIVSRNADGSFVFKGRVDDQVKIRGNRVELGEVEVNINKYPSVKQAVVKLDIDSTNQKMIVGYVQFEQKVQDQISKLRTFLEENLPSYMIPDFFIEMDDFPKTASGKVDKKALPKPLKIRKNFHFPYLKPKSEIEERLCQIFSDILQFDVVGVQDNFFEFGGNSLKAQKLVATIRVELNLEIPIVKLYQYPTVVEIVRNFISNKSNEATKTLSFNQKNKKSESHEVAVIGVAGRFPNTDNVKALWDLLINDREAIQFFENYELDSSLDPEIIKQPNYVKARGLIKEADEFDARFFGLNKMLAEAMDPQQRVFLEVAYEALESAGYRSKDANSQIGVFAGVSSNTYFLNNLMHYPEKIQALGDFQVSSLNEKDFVASRAAYHLNLTGPAVSVYSACSSSLLAIVQATESIRSGNCEVALAGGSSVKSPMKSGHLYEEGAAYSKDGHCKSFDHNAQGTVFSDGVGVVLLKDLKAAERDGDQILAVIKGVGVNNDGGGKGSFSAPSVEGQASAIRMAMNDANISPEHVKFVEAHGTGTPLGDPIEIEGLKIAFGDTKQKNYCAIGTIKSNIGHLNAASGVSGFIKAVLSIQHRKMVPVHGFEKLNTNIDLENSPFFINDRLTAYAEDEVLIAGVSSFGVGGTNVHVILSQHEQIEASDEEESKNAVSMPLHIINWSAKSEKSLMSYAARLATYVSDQEDEDIEGIASTLQLYRPDYPLRKFVLAKDKVDLLDKLQYLISDFNVHKEASREKDFAFLFTGQGAQYVGMGYELYQYFDAYRETMDQGRAYIERFYGYDILEIIFSASQSAEASQRLRQTQYTQPAIFLTEFALGNLWISLGVEPLILCGHSIGEYCAAVFAGVMTFEEALGIVCKRGQLISQLPQGSMLAVRASAAQVSSYLNSHVSLAAVNTPHACVLSGDQTVIKDLSLTLQAAGFQSRLLQTSHAFHSYMMEPVLGEFENEISKITLRRPKLPIVSSVTGSLLKDSEAMSANYWARQIVNPVLFSDALVTIDQQGSFNFLEVGPGNVLSSLVRQNPLSQRGEVYHSIAHNPNSEIELQTFLNTLGRIWESGNSVNFKPVNKVDKLIKDLPTYAFDKQRYWLDPPQKQQTEQLFAKNENLNKVENLITAREMNTTKIFSKKIQEIILDATGVQMPDENITFSEMGLDSLVLTQLGSKFRNEFGVQLSFRQLNEELQSVGQISTYIDQNISNEKKEIYLPTSGPAAHSPTLDIPQQEPTSSNFSLPNQAFTPQQTYVSNGVQNAMINMIAQQMELLSRQLNSIQQHNLNTTPPANPNQPVVPVPTSQEVQPKVNETTGFKLSEAESVELKKPFGAIARIQKKDVELSMEQKMFINAHVERLVAMTKSSKAYTQNHRSHMSDPRVVTGFKPAIKEMVYSLVVNRSLGSRIWDIDGNVYLDVLNGFGSIIFGHRPEFINERLREQLDKGYEIGPQHPLSGEVCQLLCEMTGHDRAALCNTGSEAVMGAMRIARTVTDRSLIVSFNGSYHGIFDEAIVRGIQNKKVFPAASGIMENSVQNMLVLDYGTEESLQIIRERKDEIAAVLVEPVQSRRPEFRPVEFLQKVREITSSCGAALIFDEVITGFRMHLKGAQGVFKIKADICTYGKVIGGGLSIGAIAGDKRFMDAIDGGFWQYGDDSVPEVGVTYFAGTFVRHPLSLVAAKAALEFLQKDGGKLQHVLTQKTSELAERLNQYLSSKSLPFDIVHFGSLWKFKPRFDVNYTELIFSLMREKGIQIYDGFPCFMTTAHTDEDIDFIANTFINAVEELLAVGFFKESLIMQNA
ncbi:polyketide synthase [Belliella kenyensis]|uniref:Polyketide synthase n=1 Tax=Belliella kenyensis TaxID=1472724 RepID=A0ABV8ELI6_9BACT|nr:polyketide synthase [Belliella kenyensis]MCH7403663.1 amino acid adenylation domain-containing protein [Belliella kenyensis]MDN3602183.1 amino acid adenylation domain-containing protein [Belliella kenyensis]